jgi:hypothetical protein
MSEASLSRVQPRKEPAAHVVTPEVMLRVFPSMASPSMASPRVASEGALLHAPNSNTPPKIVVSPKVVPLRIDSSPDAELRSGADEG